MSMRFECWFSGCIWRHRCSLLRPQPSPSLSGFRDQELQSHSQPSESKESFPRSRISTEEVLQTSVSKTPANHRRNLPHWLGVQQYLLSHANRLQGKANRWGNAFGSHVRGKLYHELTRVSLIGEDQQTPRHQCNRKRVMIVQPLINIFVGIFTNCRWLTCTWSETWVGTEVHHNRWSERENGNYWIISWAILVRLHYRTRNQRNKHKSPERNIIQIKEGETGYAKLLAGAQSLVMIGRNYSLTRGIPTIMPWLGRYSFMRTWLIAEGNNPDSSVILWVIFVNQEGTATDRETDDFTTQLQRRHSLEWDASNCP